MVRRCLACSGLTGLFHMGLRSEGRMGGEWEQSAGSRPRSSGLEGTGEPWEALGAGEEQGRL